MYKWISNLLKVINVIEIDCEDVLNSIINSEYCYDPFEDKNCSNQTTSFSDVMKFRFEHSDKLPKYCLKRFNTFNVTEALHSIKIHYAEMSRAEYDMFKNHRIRKVLPLIEKIKESYLKLSYTEKDDFNIAYLQTLKSVKSFLEESNYEIDKESYDYLKEIFDLIDKSLVDSKNETRNNKLENLKMEIEYLKKIKETRETYFNL